MITGFMRRHSRENTACRFRGSPHDCRILDWIFCNRDGLDKNSRARYPCDHLTSLPKPWRKTSIENPWLTPGCQCQGTQNLLQRLPGEGHTADSFWRPQAACMGSARIFRGKSACGIKPISPYAGTTDILGELLGRNVQHTYTRSVSWRLLLHRLRPLSAARPRPFTAVQ